MQHTYDLTRGDMPLILLKFYFPVLVTNCLQQAYTFADAVIVGKGIGDHALGSVGALSPLILLVSGFLTGVTNGFSVVIAQQFGAGNEAMLRKSIALSMKLCLLISLALTIIIIPILNPLLILMQTSVRLAEDSLRYGYIIFSGLAITAAFNLFSSILRALGDSSTPLNAIILSSILNILLDWILIYYFRTGVGGAALATILSQGLSVLICGYRLFKRGYFMFPHDAFTKEPAVERSLLRNGIPAACMNSVTAAGCIIVQGYVNTLGADYTSVYSACGKLLNLAMLPSVTAGFVLHTFVGQNYGSGKMRRISQGVWTGAVIAIASWLLMGGLMFMIPEHLGALLLNEREHIALTAEFLRPCGAMLLVLNLLFVFRSSVQGMGHPKIPVYSGILEMVLRILVIVRLMPRIGFSAAAYAEIVAWFGALVLNGGDWFRCIRKKDLV